MFSLAKTKGYEYKIIDDNNQPGAWAGGGIDLVRSQDPVGNAGHAGSKSFIGVNPAYGRIVFFHGDDELDSQGQHHWRDLCPSRFVGEFRSFLERDASARKVSAVQRIQRDHFIDAGRVCDIRVSFLLARFSRYGNSCGYTRRVVDFV